MKSLAPALATILVAAISAAALRGEASAPRSPNGGEREAATAARNASLTPQRESAEVLRLRETIDRSLVDHDFRKTLAAAAALTEHLPSDVAALFAKSDAHLELGEVEAAEAALQRVLDLKPCPSAYIRAGYLLHLRGDDERAIEVFGLAGSALQPTDSERRAWVSTELGEICRTSGRQDAAERHYRLALQLQPRSPKATLGLARLAWSRGELDSAALGYENAGASPADLGELALIYTELGRDAAARRALARAQALGESDPHWNRSLALCVADNAQSLKQADLDRAVTLAEAELRVRPGVHTWDAFAWALCAAGRPQDALRASERALRWGTREPLLLFHAGVAAARLGDSRATAWLDEAFVQDPALRARRDVSELTLTGRKS
jgi:tetratricopeptide (TPR) repeat protein